ncbi:helix-turn-helix domain-containing protein [Candidatus Kurthia intestinigallinarum]|uniref:helix-turn-helix domain-containing protein n=1 Tax=Candidatus Kurthia intestinigallinarum TaxID=1562256 RepID=UPI000F8C8475|nr:helix-turn-helix transcriptional regulator [Kurthia sp. 3B1D]
MILLLGDRLKKLRKEKKLTQQDLASKINVTHVSISGYESGRRSPDTDTLQKLADYFEVSTDYLLGRSDSERANISKNDEEFEAFANDPSLEKWYKELPASKEEDLRKLRKMWEILKDNGEI